MTDIEGFLAIYGHSDNLLNNKWQYRWHFPIIILLVPWRAYWNKLIQKHEVSEQQKLNRGISYSYTLHL